MKSLRTLKYESASVDLRTWEDDEAVLSNLFAGVRGQGHATELMTRVISLADKEGLTLVLDVRRFGHPIGPDNEHLIRFYEKFGFSIEATKPSIFMTRKPSQKLHVL